MRLLIKLVIWALALLAISITAIVTLIINGCRAVDDWIDHFFDFLDQ